MSNLRDRLFSADNEEPASPGKTDKTARPGAEAKGAPSKVKTKRAELSLTGAISRASLNQSENDAAEGYDLLKRRIHHRLIESIDIGRLMQMEGNQALESAIEEIILRILQEENLPLTAGEMDKLAKDVLHETLGLGPLEPLLSDPEINDILVNGHRSIWIDRNGKLIETEIRFSSEEHLLHVINRIVARVGRRVDESSPIVDARLPDGSRINAIIPPLSLEGPVLSIRRFRATPFHLEDLIERGALNKDMAEFLKLSVNARLNILISGGTSAGKTTLLNVLSEHISDSERIVTIEDTAELRLQQRHVVRLESRPANIEGRGSINQRELVKNALRMRPDRIVVGEVRGAEALDMLQAMNTGHEGSLTTVHANTARDAMSRIETLVLLAGVELSQRSIREQIGSAFDLIVQIKRLSDGTRRVVSISELTGVQEGVISMQELFIFKHTETDAESHRVNGFHTACGLRPSLLDKFKEAGIDLPTEMFQEKSGEPQLK
ncbi:MAG: CpaF family protein [Candidatus Obscuribacterales bacterium]|nr:CpaF family protein [Candidatus Obscuribacterales bacterium]